jgi:UPF0716 protein FxsA
MISDFAALVVMIGPLRRRLSRWINGPAPEKYAPRRDHHENTTIEGDFRNIDDQ